MWPWDCHPLRSCLTSFPFMHGLVGALRAHSLTDENSGILVAEVAKQIHQWCGFYKQKAFTSCNLAGWVIQDQSASRSEV